MMKGGRGQANQLHDINWGALDHASHALQLMSCNYYLSVCVCVCVCRGMTNCALSAGVSLLCSVS